MKGSISGFIGEFYDLFFSALQEDLTLLEYRPDSHGRSRSATSMPSHTHRQLTSLCDSQHIPFRSGFLPILGVLLHKSVIFSDRRLT